MKASGPTIAPIDTGSVNLESYDAATRTFSHAERVYINRTDTLQMYARDFAASGIKPQLVTWSIGFTRRAEALMEQGLVDEPAYFLINMTDGACLTGHPGTPEGLPAVEEAITTSGPTMSTSTNLPPKLKNDSRPCAKKLGKGGEDVTMALPNLSSEPCG